MVEIYLDVSAQRRFGDENWFLCAPGGAGMNLDVCPDLPFREVEISIDGQPAGVAPVYPRFFPAGLDPALWSPIPGVQALDYIPYRVNLTPFAGLLNDGQPHAIGIQVYDVNAGFSGVAQLLLYQ